MTVISKTPLQKQKLPVINVISFHSLSQRNKYYRNCNLFYGIFHLVYKNRTAASIYRTAQFCFVYSLNSLCMIQLQSSKHLLILMHTHLLSTVPQHGFSNQLKI